MSKKRIAIVSIWFPPQQSVATNRILSFVQYLSEDYQIEVFTLGMKNHSVEWSQDVLVHYCQSNKLFDRLKSDNKSSKWKHKIRTAIKVVLSYIIKSPLKKWQKLATRKIIERNSIEPFDCIISSFAPIEAHLAVVDFFDKTEKIHWIADMRDEMSTNPHINQATREKLRKVEKEVNRYASAVTSVSEPILNDFKSICGDVKFFEEIRNGYDHSFKREGQQKNKIFTIGYFGTFYGGRKPDLFFKALIGLLQSESDFDVRIETYGSHANFDIPKELKNKVKLNPGLPYKDGIKMMAQMDLNLMLHPTSIQKGIFTGKLFDYISVQKPVLALVDKEDVAAKLIREMQCGYVAEFFDEDEIRVQLKQAWRDWCDDRILKASDDDRNSLHRKFQAKKMKMLIEKMLIS